MMASAKGAQLISNEPDPKPDNMSKLVDQSAIAISEGDEVIASAENSTCANVALAPNSEQNKPPQ